MILVKAIHNMINAMDIKIIVSHIVQNIVKFQLNRLMQQELMIEATKIMVNFYIDF
jgi:hypothetical protein